MGSILKETYLVVILVLISACSTYHENDYGDSITTPIDESTSTTCINMDSAQKALCKERENKLIISLGAEKNCSYPYEYQKNNCKNEKSKQKKSLDKSLEKHVK